MSGYLLLRDNKQTGPYSCEELIAKGFKAYDLIWAEGKSAGWRYPSEFPEFAKHAPVIEEQPFDRFYKKPTGSTSNSQSPSSTRKPVDNKPPVLETETSAGVEPEIPKIESRPAKLVALEKKNIFVTLPSDSVARPTVNIRKSTEIAPVPRIDEVPEGIISELDKKEISQPENIVPVKETLTEKVDLPASESKSVAVVKKDQDWSQYNLQATPVKKSEQTSTEKYKQEKKTDSFHVERPSVQETHSKKADKNQIFIRAAVATCLLLGGVVIGLAISTSKQSAEQEALSKLVNEKIQQSQQKQTITPITKTEDNPPVTVESIPTAADDSKLVSSQEELIKPAIQSDNGTKKSEAIPAVKKETETPKKEESVVVSEKKPAEPVHKEDPAAETARKNIFNLVSVVGNKYKVGVLGGISNLELTLSNNSLYPIDQVEVVVNYHGPENRIVRKETVMINDIAAGTQKIVAVPKSKRGVSVTYSINRINSKALGLAHAGL